MKSRQDFVCSSGVFFKCLLEPRPPQTTANIILMSQANTSSFPCLPTTAVSEGKVSIWLRWPLLFSVYPDTHLVGMNWLRVTGRSPISGL